MSIDEPGVPDRSQLWLRALSRWGNEGGVSREGAQDSAIPNDCLAGDESRLTNAELIQLRVRVIALENLLIALLADALVCQTARVRELESYISPKPSFTSQLLTTRAAAHMIDLVERAALFRSASVDEGSPPVRRNPMADRYKAGDEVGWTSEAGRVDPGEPGVRGVSDLSWVHDNKGLSAHGVGHLGLVTVGADASGSLTAAKAGELGARSGRQSMMPNSNRAALGAPRMRVMAIWT